MRHSPTSGARTQNCPFSKSCPYLRGESPAKILAERNYLRRRVEEMENLFSFAEEEITRLKGEVNQLQEENKTLTEDLTQAKQALFRKPKRKTSPDSPRKRGAPIGLPRTSRKRPQDIDEVVVVPLQKCPICGGSNLSRCKRTDEHVQEDIVILKAITRCFVHLYYWCPDCKKVVSGVGENEIPKAPIGPVVPKAFGTSFLRHEIKISYDDIQRIFHSLFGLKISPGAIVGFDNKIYQKGLLLYESLKKMLPYTHSIHVDETGWKRDGIPEWLWTFTNQKLAFYHIDPHRSSDVVKEHLGSDYKGILSSDFYSAYNRAIKAFAKQKCNAHLLRDVKELQEKFPDDPEVSSFCHTLKDIIQDAILLHSQHDKLTKEEWKSHGKSIFRRFKKLYKAPLSNPDAETLRKRLLKHKDEILTFLKHPEIEPTNNRAETALRSLVLLRKIIFGSRSEQGTKNVSLNTTIIKTAKLNGLDPIEVLKTLLTKGLTPELSKQFGLPQTRSP